MGKLSCSQPRGETSLSFRWWLGLSWWIYQNYSAPSKISSQLPKQFNYGVVLKRFPKVCKVKSASFQLVCTTVAGLVSKRSSRSLPQLDQAFSQQQWKLDNIILSKQCWILVKMVTDLLHCGTFYSILSLSSSCWHFALFQCFRGLFHKPRDQLWTWVSAVS